MPIISRSSGSTPTTVRVGAYNARTPGPDGSAEWETDMVRRRHNGAVRNIALHYQEAEMDLVDTATIRVHDEIDVACHHATVEQLNVMDATLHLVPPGHLRLLTQRKPQGFLLAGTAGAGASRSYTGGVNPRFDDRSTPDLDERRLIIITYGAWWRFRGLGTCPTVLHEIGHVMTHRGEINYEPFPEARRRQLAGSSVSRNPGALEALCNAYMYFLCYAAADREIQDFGARPPSEEKDGVTRAALRRCRAFRGPLLDETWQSRFAERTS